MEDEETNMSAVLQLLKQIKKDVESLKDQNKQCSRSRKHSCCDGAGGEEQQETFQRNHFHRLYSFQGRDDLGLCFGAKLNLEKKFHKLYFTDFTSLENSLSHYE